MTAFVTTPDGKLSEGIARRKIEGTVEKDGKTYFRTRTSMDASPIKGESTMLVRKDEKAFYSIDESVPGSVEQVEIPLPLKVGATWTRKRGPLTITDTVMGLETVSISGRKFENCYHIRSIASDGSSSEDFWEAPNVGSIKSKIVYRNGMKITLAVKDFKIAK